VHCGAVDRQLCGLSRGISAHTLADYFECSKPVSCSRDYSTTAAILVGIVVGTIAGIFWRMQGGFGPYNLRPVDIVFVGTLAALLGLTGRGKTLARLRVHGALAIRVGAMEKSGECPLAF
jgi:hypothetical protein